MSEAPAKVFVVDDDPSIRKALVRLFRSTGIEAEAFGSAADFLARDPAEVPSCLVLDVQMPGLTGPDLQRRLKDAGNPIPVVFLTAHGDVPMAAHAMKVGAVDVLTKPVDEADLLRAVHDAIARDDAGRLARNEIEVLRQRHLRLTPREREVLTLVIAGLLNKQIAQELGTSQRTVKVHRGRVMRKMQAGSVADLVRYAERLGIAPAPLGARAAQPRSP